MADVITRLKVDSSEYDSKLKRATQGLQHMEEALHRAGKSFIDADKGQVEFVRQLGQMGTVSTTAKGKIGEMSQAFVELSLQYKRMSEQEKSSPIGKALSESLDQLKGRIGEAKQQLSDVNAEMGKTTQEGSDMSGMLGMLAAKFGVSTQVLTAFGAVVGGVTVALKVAKDAFMMSESNIDSWGRTVEGAKGAYESFLASLNIDSWGNFFGNIEKAINGAMDLYDAIDRLNSVKSNNAAAIAYWRNEVQRLRVEKQNGGDVDLLLKSAEGNLKSLQSQGIQAGKSAGRQQIGQTLLTAYNQQTGAGARLLSAADQKKITDSMLMYGQSYFDEQKSIRDRLAKKAEDSYSTIFGEQRYVNINKLSEAEKKQYLVANAVTEAETRLQKGINQYAQALGEEASANREEFKTNRYVLQGSGGKGGGRAVGSSGAAWAPIAMEAVGGVSFGRSIADIEKDISKYQQKYKNAGDVGESLAAKTMMERYQRELEARKSLENPFAAAYKHDFGRDIEKLNRDNEKNAKKQELTYSEQLKGIDQMVGGISAMVGSLQNIGLDIPEGFNKMLGGMQAILTVLEAIQTIDTVGNILGIFSNGGVVRAAEGWSGVVPGNRFSGDQVPALLNSQELVLNTAQTGRVASALQGAQSSNSGTPYVDGEKIYLGVNNYLRRSGKGEIVTAR